MPMDETIGERTTRLRTKRSMSQSALAKAAGVPLSIINMLEAGVRSGENLRVETARKIANALGVTLDYLCGPYEDDDSERLPTHGALVGA
jgi:transcriptional regulator with XRE-family HTH domain